jgi:uncharacterized protein YbjT (DUF2867 family)
MRERVLFIAGSTGAVGRSLVAAARAAHVPFLAHQRLEHGPAGPDVASFELDEEPRLEAALADATTVVQLIGTTRKRFARGDTYETSDVGTTRQLVDAAKRAAIDHVVLLSSVGAGRPVGAYLRAKAEAERIVRDSGLAFTIVRPSAFEGAGHHPPPGMRAVTRFLGLSRYEPIRVEDLAQLLLHVGKTRAPLDGVLEGESLWRELALANAAP